jgi:hypothetical protein
LIRTLILSFFEFPFLSFTYLLGLYASLFHFSLLLWRQDTAQRLLSDCAKISGPQYSFYPSLHSFFCTVQQCTWRIQRCLLRIMLGHCISAPRSTEKQENRWIMIWKGF